jgi:hypothetical protein
MIDYYAHVAGLEVIRKAIDAAGGGSHGAEWVNTKNALAAEPACALLGTLLDHLLERAEGADREHELLEEAVVLFGEAKASLGEFGGIRSDFDAMVKAPETATTEQFNALVDRLRALEPKLKSLSDRADAYRARITPPFTHVQPHGIAADRPVSVWLWRDVFLSRRTDALVAALQAAGGDSDATRSLAFGTLAGYAANCVGSSYLGHVVRGPRRSHPLRDRMGRYAVGAWLRKNQSALCPSLTDLRTQLQFPTAGLPTAVRDQINAALADAFPVGAPGAGPDLDAGYVKLLRHLELLEAFDRQPLPPDIDPSLLVKVMQSPAATNALIEPQEWPGPFQNPQPGEQGHDPTEPPNPTPDPTPGKDTQGSSCGLFVLAALLVMSIVGLIIWKLAVGRWPWESSAQAENPGESSQALSNFLKSDNALMTVSYFYHAHTHLALAIAAGLKTLKRVGLLYPDELDLMELSFNQFTTLPDGGSYPHRPVADADSSYLEPPTSAIEEPGTHPSAFPAGATPDTFLSAPGALPTVARVGAELWLQHQSPPGPNQENRNSDADRGDGHLCWRITPGGSIANNPVPITVLAYAQVD